MKILVVEDEFLLALSLEDELQRLGHSIVGPCHDLASATAAARSQDFDVALLDVNLRGEMTYALADEIGARGKGFIFLSGYGTANLPERFKAAPRLPKPYDPMLLAREIDRFANARGS